MSLEQNVEKLTVAVDKLTAVILQESANASAPTLGPISGPVPGPCSPPAITTIEELREFAGTLVKKEGEAGYDKARIILDEFGVKRFDELDTKDYAAAAKRFQDEIKKTKPKSKAAKEKKTDLG